MSGPVVEHVSTKDFVKFGESRSSRSRDIPAAHFVMDYFILQSHIRIYLQQKRVKMGVI